MDTDNQADVWQQRYEQQNTGWDMGEISPPLKAYIDQLPASAKQQNILVAGAGNAYEVGYLHEQGFTNVTLVDFAPAPIQAFAARYPDFPAEQLICADFFTLAANNLPISGQFDWVMEQTFFCAINPTRRDDYVQQMAKLLKPQGKLVGLLFDADFGEDFPPFGGTPEEYRQRFAPYFDIEVMTPCYNSHPARKGNELFVKMRAKV